MPDGPDYEAPCPHCQRPAGEHTLVGYRDCLQQAGFDYDLPHEDVPGGPLHFPAVQGQMAGEVSVGSGFIDTPVGRLPVLRFNFVGAGAKPMQRVPLDPITLVMDAGGLKRFRQLVATAVDRSILGARRGR